MREQAGGGLGEGLEGDLGLFTEDSGQEAEEEGRATGAWQARPGWEWRGGRGCRPSPDPREEHGGQEARPGQGSSPPRPSSLLRAEVQRVPPGGRRAGAWLQCPDRKTLENL